VPIRETTVVQCPVLRNKLSYVATQDQIDQRDKCQVYEGKNSTVPRRAKILTVRKKRAWVGISNLDLDAA
jgi:hypothetical protein